MEGKRFNFLLDVKSKTTDYSDELTGRYIVPVGATGLWEGKDNQIAEKNGDSWVFTEPKDYDAVKVLDEPFSFKADLNNDGEDEVYEGFYYFKDGKWRRFQKIQTVVGWIQKGREHYNIPYLTLGGVVKNLTHDVVIDATPIGNTKKKVRDLWGDDTDEEVAVIVENELFIVNTDACKKVDKNGNQIRPHFATTGGILKNFTTKDSFVANFIKSDLTKNGERIKFVQDTGMYILLDGQIPLFTTGGILKKFSTNDVGIVCQVIIGRAVEKTREDPDWRRF
ncbi:DUF2793 domain-containing protein [bacterium]|nr:DUF2793 domain-containing protein [bacterium]